MSQDGGFAVAVMDGQVAETVASRDAGEDRGVGRERSESKTESASGRLCLLCPVRTDMILSAVELFRGSVVNELHTHTQHNKELVLQLGRHFE